MENKFTCFKLSRKNVTVERFLEEFKDHMQYYELKSLRDKNGNLKFNFRLKDKDGNLLGDQSTVLNNGDKLSYVCKKDKIMRVRSILSFHFPHDPKLGTNLINVTNADVIANKYSQASVALRKEQLTKFGKIGGNSTKEFFKKKKEDEESGVDYKKKTLADKIPVEDYKSKDGIKDDSLQNLLNPLLGNINFKTVQKQKVDTLTMKKTDVDEDLEKALDYMEKMPENSNPRIIIPENRPTKEEQESFSNFLDAMISVMEENKDKIEADSEFNEIDHTLEESLGNLTNLRIVLASYITKAHNIRKTVADSMKDLDGIVHEIELTSRKIFDEVKFISQKKRGNQ